MNMRVFFQFLLVLRTIPAPASYKPRGQMRIRVDEVFNSPSRSCLPASSRRLSCSLINFEQVQILGINFLFQFEPVIRNPDDKELKYFQYVASVGSG